MRRLEELSANAWPGLRAALVDGWIIRFAEGYSSRANSVLPLYPGKSSMAEKISHCENLAQSRGVRPTFKLFPDMEHILPRPCFLLLEGEDGPVACALAVMEDGWAGIFDVTVRKELRGRGLGQRIMEITLAEAGAEGASRSYLQVVNGNRAAEELYRRLGYTVAYSYWYRVKPEKP